MSWDITNAAFSFYYAVGITEEVSKYCTHGGVMDALDHWNAWCSGVDIGDWVFK